MRTHTLQPDPTPRQLEILFTLMEGASNRDIATRLGVSEQTVNSALTIMYEKMACRTACIWRSRTPFRSQAS